MKDPWTQQNAQLPLDTLPPHLEQAYREVVYWSAVNVSVLNLPGDTSLVLTTKGLYLLEGRGRGAARIQRIEHPATLEADRDHRRLVLEAPGTRVLLDYEPRREAAVVRFADAFSAQETELQRRPVSRSAGRWSSAGNARAMGGTSASPDSARAWPEQSRGSGVLGKAFLLVGALIAAVIYWYHAGPVPHSFHLTDISAGSARTSGYEGPREVRVRRDRSGHYVLRGRIDGVRVRFLLDTGATHVAIPAHVAEAADLRWGRRGRTITANGEGVAYNTVIGTLEIGDITLHNIHASIIPGMTSNEVLLGMSALRQLEFSQKGRELVLRQP